MSPVLILSRLCLKRRFQFFGISEHSSDRTASTFWTVSSSITRRRPASAAFSVGTMTVMSLWRILIVRYSRLSPITSFSSLRRTLPAPWCGYTTLSPISNSMSGGRLSGSRSSSCSSVSSVMVSSSYRGPGRACPSLIASRLQVAINEVDLLLSAKALADVLRPDLADTVDGLQLAIRCGEQFLEASELRHDPLHDQSRQPGYPSQNSEPARRNGVVEGIQLAVVAEQFGEPTEVQQVLMGKPHELVDDDREAVVGVLHKVVVDERRLVGRDADHRLVELHLDQPAFG